METLRVVGNFLAIFTANGDPVRLSIDGCHVDIAAALEIEVLAAGRVVEHVAGVIFRCPLAIGAGELGAWYQGGKELAVHRDDTPPLELHSDSPIDLAAAGVVGRHDDRVLRPGCVISGDNLDALAAVLDLLNPSLFLQHGNPCRRLVPGELLDSSEESWVLLAHNFV